MVKICPQEYPEESPYNERFAEYPYPLSAFQKWAIESIIEGNHVLVTAHTGSGKTLPAEFAIRHFTNQKKKVIYTSPIKALSNQKFYEFTHKYPEISFGLFTGDIKTNPNADVLIMTTEILMNYLYMQNTRQDKSTESTENGSNLQFQIDIQKELACVIFDEVHYINDADRGQVWEQTILMLPKHIQMVMLSATIDNPAGFAEWIEARDTTTSEARDFLMIEENNDDIVLDNTKENPEKIVYLASTNHRVVPLTHYSFLTTIESIFKHERDKTIQQQIRDSTNCLLTLQTHGGQFQEKTVHKINGLAKIFDTHRVYMKRQAVLNKLTEHLRVNEMLPAIAFIFSRKHVEQCAHEITTNLLEDDSKIPYTIRRECEQIIRKFPNFKEYLELPEYNELVGLLEKGIGIHHSGMIPVLREIVELMISKKYIKLLFATESFAIGLDCPIKTAIFPSLTKFDGHSPRFLYSHEYTQMAGRAGRRGIDTVGHVIHCNQLFQNNHPTLTEYKSILSGQPQKLVSKFHIHYGVVLNLLKTSEQVSIQEICSFVEKSMLSRELMEKSESIKEEINVLEKLRDKKEAAVAMNKMPIEKCKRVLEIQANLSMMTNKRRKEIEREITGLKDDYRTFDQDLLRYKEFLDSMNIIIKEDDRMGYMDSYIIKNIENICYILEKYGLVERIETDGFDNYILTNLGKISSNLAEIHPVINAILFSRWNQMTHFSPLQLIQYFITFTDIKVPEDFRKYNYGSENMFMKSRIGEVNELMYEFIDMERDLDINTGIRYDSMLNYDFIDEIEGWVNAEDELQCKTFIQTVVYGKEVSVGDFTKAILKVSNITREFMNIAETSGNIELLQNLSKIDGLILKYVTTAQSLYV